ncbi:MAG: glycosyltransferase family 25 protein [Hyphomicrobiales bacterium]|nr:glycosyltransferase family 25 protein [Hyphomicrobiales bacterium]
MRVYWINLDRRPDRRALMEPRLAGFDHERVAAVDGASLPTTTGPLSLYERACLESHREAWRRFLATDASCACVLEDDLRLSPGFAAFVATDSWFPAKAHVVKLDTVLQEVMLDDGGFHFSGRVLRRLRTHHESGGAYVLGREGAERFLALGEAADTPVDYVLFPRDPAWRGVNAFQVTPAVAIQEEFLDDATASVARSSIQRLTTKRRRSLSAKLRREVGRIGRDAGRAAVNAYRRHALGLEPTVVRYE